MSARVEWTDYLDAKLEKLVAYGFENPQIAAHLGFAVGSVHGRLSRLGLRERLTTTHRQAVVRLHGEGVGTPRIAKRIGLTVFSVDRVLIETGLAPAPVDDAEIAGLRVSLAHLSATKLNVPHVLTGRRAELQRMVDEGLTDWEISTRIGNDLATVKSTIERLVIKPSRRVAA